MDLIQHTLQWTKGEILEATIFGVFGLTVIICGILFWTLGNTPNAKAMVIPLLVVGLFYTIAGVSGVIRNNQRIHQYQAAYQKDPVQFVEIEKTRVKGFDTIFKVTYPLAAAFILAGLLLFLFLGGPHIKAIGLALILLGLSVYTIDHFAAERADIYYQHILNAAGKG